jgi:S-DNA-T family DNA segregation ATPase FtsK/SpoIIIE
MNILGPTRYARLNEAAAIVFLIAGLFVLLSLASYSYQDSSWDTVSGSRPQNLTGAVGAYLADLAFQLMGLTAYLLPGLILVLGWKWVRSTPIQSSFIKLGGTILLVCSLCTSFGLGPEWKPIGGVIPAGGLVGDLLSDYLVQRMNVTGAALLTLAGAVLSIYLVSTFSMAKLASWFAGPIAWIAARLEQFRNWRAERARIAAAKAQERAERRAAERAEKYARQQAKIEAAEAADPPVVLEDRPKRSRRAKPGDPPIVDTPPWEEPSAAPPDAVEEDIPIRELELPPVAAAEAASAIPPPPVRTAPKPVAASSHYVWKLPPLALLNEPPGRNPYDSQELKDIAARIKSKFEEFNVLGSVVQINPGPVVTTFEFKPEAGVKYSRITTLTEDLCLGLQAESILIERIPGKPTVGIEVPNTKREVISLRQILESEEFQNSQSPLTIPLGKDISGRIRVTALESMPHLLIAGSTGSGKSVMLNSMIMSILCKSTPDEVRMIMVDPKRLELGLYEGIPHLLTPVITDPKKATNALRNAVLEMERRLKLLASYGVRNIDQFNRKIRQLQMEPRSLFEEEGTESEELQTLPYILILIDELADLMMLERANVEESVARLAQMARAVGMHLVLATQRPSVDVITGLIKANFPSRISFRVATRVDSRTVLDVMGAEHLLGKGDMLFLPPGSSRLTRVHGAYITETETNRVVEFWKEQAAPEYDKSFLLAPPEDDGENGDEDFDGEQDPMYQDAVRVVVEIGKASTSTLQRRLRLGYGRAARILDMMQREGIIGPPDGSRPREVLKRPDWLYEVESSPR